MIQRSGDNRQPDLGETSSFRGPEREVNIVYAKAKAPRCGKKNNIGL